MIRSLTLAHAPSHTRCGLIDCAVGYASIVSRIPLPPLPPVPGDARPGGRSMVDILADQHRDLLDLSERLADGGAAHGRAANVLCAMTVRHLSAEEQYLYPAARAALPDGDRLADAEVTADARLQEALRRLSVPAAEARDAVVRALHGHVTRCEQRLFPALRAALDDTTLIRLGNRVVIAGESAPTRPHPGTPFTPPWNRLVEPAVGVLDKIRDGLTGRPTRPERLGSR